MRNFYMFVAFNVVFLALWLGLVWGQTGNSSKMSQWVYDVYGKKTAIAKKIDGEKIVIVSGSNALFGVDSKMLERAFEKPVVNYGVNAGVLLPYTLYKAKEVINKGDVVLLPLEYPMYNYDGVANSQMIDYIFARDIEAFNTLSLYEQFGMVWSVEFKRILDGYSGYVNKPIKRGLYGAHNVDGHGDQRKTSLKYKTKGIKKELDSLVANSYGADFDADSLGFTYLEEFVTWCERKGAICIFMPSTLMWFDSYKSVASERWFYENIADVVRSKGWKFVGVPYEYMYDKKFYFNTDFHLTNKGREMRTKKMIKDLEKFSDLGLDVRF